MKKAERSFERTRCTARWTVTNYSEDGPRTVRCVMIHGHDGSHWKGLIEWTDASTTVDDFHAPGSPAPAAVDDIVCDLHDVQVPCPTCCAEQLAITRVQ